MIKLKYGYNSAYNYSAFTMIESLAVISCMALIISLCYFVYSQNYFGDESIKNYASSQFENFSAVLKHEIRNASEIMLFDTAMRITLSRSLKGVITESDITYEWDAEKIIKNDNAVKNTAINFTDALKRGYKFEFKIISKPGDKYDFSLKLINKKGLTVTEKNETSGRGI